jgi:hypothetical protein
VIIAAVLLFTAGCTSIGGTPTVAGASHRDPATVAPLGQALPVTVDKAVVRPGVVRVPVQQVKQVTPDGKSFVLTAQGAAGLTVGSVMVIDGVASRVVTAVAPAAGAVTVDTRQATTDEVFSDLDVRFDGHPDPSNAVFGTPAESDGPAATIEPIDPDESSGPAPSGSPGSSVAPSSSAPSSSAPATGPSRLRGSGAAVAPSGDGQLTVVKELAGNTGAAAGKTFALTVDCSTGGDPAAGFPVSLSFSGAGSRQIPAPVGSTCSVSEPYPQGAVPTVSDPVVIAAPDGDYRLTVTNTFTAGGGAGEPGNQPGNQPNQPGNQPNQPGNQPDQPGNQPGNQPNQPGNQPNQPGNQPNQPGNQPNGGQTAPDTRPTAPRTSPKPSASPTASSPDPTVPSSFDQVSCAKNSASFKVPLKGYSVTGSIGRNAACTGYILNADISSANAALTSSIGIRADVLDPAIKGRITAGASGTSGATSITLNGALTVGGNADAANAGGYLARAKLSWDVLKVDYPFAVLGVPFVVRIGVSASIEYRLSGRHDTVSAQFISGSCRGTVTLPNLSTVDTSTCVMQPATVDSFLTLAPAGMVVAAGFKVGIGPGVVVPFALLPVDPTGKLPGARPQAVAFAGITGTLAFAVGLSTTGATSIGVRDCLRTDRSVQAIGSADASLGPLSASIAHTFWEKTDTNYSGPRCPQGK